MEANTARKPHQRYRLANGDQVPGVTTVLSVINKPALIVWANKLGLDGVKSAEFVADAADAGILAHLLIAAHLTGQPPDASGFTPSQHTRAENALASFDAWARGKALATQETELSLISETHRYGGTLDALVRLDGVPTVVDFKTSNAIYPEHLAQVVAYRELLIENGYEVDACLVLRLSRDGDQKYEQRVISGPAIECHWQVFLAALLLKNAIDATKERGAR